MQPVSLGGAASGAAPAPSSRVRRVRQIHSHALRRVLRRFLLQQILSGQRLDRSPMRVLCARLGKATTRRGHLALRIRASCSSGGAVD
eukprot:7376099-Prymnesium_polylepis.1